MLKRDLLYVRYYHYAKKDYVKVKRFLQSKYSSVVFPFLTLQVFYYYFVRDTKLKKIIMRHIVHAARVTLLIRVERDRVSC